MPKENAVNARKIKALQNFSGGYNNPIERRMCGDLMEKRMYQRVKLNIDILCYIQGAPSGKIEFSGKIINISECGIAVKVTDERYVAIVDETPIGSEFRFLFVDEYELFKEEKIVHVEGTARIVRKDKESDTIIVGCEIRGRKESVEKYVSDRKLISFYKNRV